MAFREQSIALTETLSKQDKKQQGIFFTPKDARDVVFRILTKHKVCPTSILEPSFGSGEFLEDAYEQYPSATITGVELNPTLFQSVQRPNLHNMNFLDYTGTHDLILGNPPYFVIPRSDETAKCQTGRPNIFVQFLFKAIEHNLSKNGYLAFVLPTSFFNCGYYEPMRRYLRDHTTVLAVTLLGGSYIDTEQDTFALVVRKKKGKSNFFLEIGDHLYLTPYAKELTTLRLGSTVLAELGFEVRTGDVVWNQEKDILADTGTLLLYSSNLRDGHVDLTRPLKSPKKQYIQGFGRPPLSGKTILINRGYGNTKYTLSGAIADFPEYYAENHVNVIKPLTSDAEANIERVYTSLQDPRTQEFIRLFLGNGALSKTELECCLPIWLD